MADRLNKILGIEIDDNASAGLRIVDQNITKVTQSTSNHTKTTQSNTKSLLENGGAMGLLNDATGGLAMTFKDAAEAIGLSGNALKGLRGAIIATGIAGLAIILLELITNWDKWSGVIDGSTRALEDNEKALKALNSEREKFVQRTEYEVDLAEAQGKSEEEIYNKRIRNIIKLIEFKKQEQELLEAQYRMQFNADRDSEETEKARLARESKKLEIQGLANQAYVLNAQFVRRQEELAAEAIKKSNETTAANAKKLAADAKKRYEDLLKEAEKFFTNAEAAEKAYIENVTKLREEQVSILNDNLPKSPEDLAQSSLETLNAISQNEYMTFQQRLQNVKDFQEQIKSNEQLTAEIKEYYLNQSAETEKTILEAQMAYREQIFRTNYDNLQNILSLGGKKLAGISKALAIADVVRSTYKSISTSVGALTEANAKAVAASPLTGGQPWVTTNTVTTGIGIASAVASGIKAIQAITSEQKSIGSGGGAGAAGGGASGAQAQFNIVGASGTNQLAARIGAAQNQPVNAYVVGTDVSTQQALDRNRITNATFL